MYPTWGANFSVLVAKRPIAPTAPAGRAAATKCLVGEYMTNYDYCELTTLNFRRPTALLSRNTTQTGRADNTAPGHDNIGNFVRHRTLTSTSM